MPRLAGDGRHHQLRRTVLVEALLMLAVLTATAQAMADAQHDEVDQQSIKAAR